MLSECRTLSLRGTAANRSSFLRALATLEQRCLVRILLWGRPKSPGFGETRLSIVSFLYHTRYAAKTIIPDCRHPIGSSGSFVPAITPQARDDSYFQLPPFSLSYSSRFLANIEAWRKEYASRSKNASFVQLSISCSHKRYKSSWCAT